MASRALEEAAQASQAWAAVEFPSSSAAVEAPAASARTEAAAQSTAAAALQGARETASNPAAEGRAPSEEAGRGIPASVRPAVAAPEDTKWAAQRAEEQAAEQSEAASSQETALQCHGRVQRGRAGRG